MSTYAADDPGAANGAAQLDFRCVRHDAGGGTVGLAVFGELDLATAPVLDRALRSAQQHALLLVLDLRQLAFIDCSGLRVVLAAATRARANAARFLVVRGPPHVDRLLELTGVERQLETTHAGRNGTGRASEGRAASPLRPAAVEPVPDAG